MPVANAVAALELRLALAPPLLAAHAELHAPARIAVSKPIASATSKYLMF